MKKFTCDILFLLWTSFLITCAGGEIQVIGRLGETVTLQCPLNSPAKISWMFDDNGEKILLAEFRDQKFIRVNGNYFSRRLEGSNSGTALRIKHLRMEDGGVFTAHITVNGSATDISYVLTVLGRGDIILPVTGLVGGNVTLPTYLTLPAAIEKISWMFHDKGKKIHLAELRNQKFSRLNKNYFYNRLEKSNDGTALQIRELRMEDSGIFTAHIHLYGRKRDISYILAVFEPIPTPVIKVTFDENSTDLCHLHCSVPSNSPTLSYSWTYRDTGTDRLYANGSTITVSLKDKALGAEFTCWVRNPAHSNSVSVVLNSLGGRQTEIRKEIQPGMHKEIQLKIETEVRPGIQTELQPKIQTEIRPGIQTEIRTKIPTELQPEIKTKLEPGIQIDLQPKIQTELQPKIKTEIRPGIQTEIRTKIQTEIQPKIKTEIQPGIQTEIRPGIQTEIRPGIQTEIRPGIQTEIQTKLEPGIQIDLQPKIQTEIQPKIKTEIRPGIQTEIRTKIQTELRPEIKTKLEPGIQTELQPKIQTEIQPKIQTEIQPKIQTEIQSKIQTEIQPRIQTEIQPKIQTEIQPRIQTEIQPRIQTEILPELRTTIKTDTKSEIQTDIKIQTEEKIKAGGEIQVIGRLGETVTLQCPLNSPAKISWMFDNNGEKILLAEYRDQKFIRVNNNYFINRLEGSNSGTALRIKHLRMEDGGVFTAHITVNGSATEIIYVLTVLGRGDIILPVTGLVGGNVTLPTYLTLPAAIERISWMFHDKGKRIHLAEFRHQKFITVNKKYFLNRLEKPNDGTALRIRELRMEDSGIFTAHIHFNGRKRDISYILAVFEPIPTPVIKVTFDENSPDLCHLHCSVPSNSPTLSYSWTYRDTGNDRLYANGSTITVSLKDKALGAEFTCWVQNPAHRNNASVPLKSLHGRRTGIQTEIQPWIQRKIQSKIQKEIRPDIKAEIQHKIQTDTKLGTQTEIQPGTEIHPEIQPEIQIELRPRIQTEIQPDIKAEIRPKIQAGIHTELQPKIKTEIRPGTQTELRPEIKTELRPEIKTELRPEIKTEIRPGTQTELRPEIKTELRPEIKTELRPGIKTEIRPGTQTEIRPEIKTELRPEIKTEIRPGTQTELRPGIQTELRPEIKTELRPEIKTELRPEIKTELRPEIKTEIQQGIQTELRPEIKTELVPGIRTDIQPGIQTDLRTEIQKKIQTDTKPEILTEVQTDIKRQTKAKIKAGGDIQVIGRVGETVTLQCPLNLPTRILWTYDDNGEKILLAEYRDQKFIRVNNNYFINRLEGSNSGTALLIRELKREDSGVFTAHITVNGSATDISYILNVLGRGDIILPVTGLVGGNVTLPTYLTLPAAIERISLMFHDKGKKIHLAELRNHKFSRLNKDYFYNRLEKSNDGTALQIRELRMEDSGIFTAHIHVNGQKRDISYILAVFEPIPTPVIEVTSDENFPDLCHLHCSVPSNSPTLSYSWTYRDTGTDRLYANGSTITVSLKDKALGAEFTCWVQNPAHRNSVSVVLKSYSGRQTGIQPKIRPEIQQKIQTETQPEIKTEIRPGIKTEIQPEIKTEIQPGIKTEKQPGILTEIRPGIKTEMRPGVQKEIQLGIQKEIRSEIQTEIRQGIQRETQKETEIKAGGDIQVIGRVGETVTLQCPLNLPTRILWTYDDNGEKILLAEYRDQKFIRVNNNYFINRLEGSNSGTALRIKNLRMEDGGVFTAHITVNGSATEISYIVNVFGRGDIIVQATGREGDTVTLPTYMNHATSIERISWMFHDKGKKIHLAEFRNHKFIRVNKNYFPNRLEKSNYGTALQIKELRMEDSGIFTAHIYANGRKRDISYILVVFELIPTPVIEVTYDENFTDLCHLHCSVNSNSTTLSYSWTYRDNGTDILYANGSTISILLKNMASGSEFTCLVQNPVHRNSASVLLKSLGGRRTDIRKEIQTEIRQGIQREIQPEIQTEIRPGIQREIQPEIQTEIRTGIQREIQTEIRPGIQREIQPEIQREIQPEIQTEIQTEIRQGIQREIQPEIQTEIQTEIRQGIQREIQPEIQTEIRPGIQREIQPKIQTEIQTEIRPGIQREIQPEIQTEIRPGIQREIQPEIQTEIRPGIQKEIQPEIQTEIQTEIRPGIQKETRRKIHKEIEPNIQTEIEKEMQPDIRPEIHTEIEKDIQPEIQSETPREAQIKGPKKDSRILTVIIAVSILCGIFVGIALYYGIRRRLKVKNQSNCTITYSEVLTSTQDKEHIKDSITYSEVQINTQDKVHTKDTITYSDVQINSRRNMQGKEEPDYNDYTITFSEGQRHTQNKKQSDDAITYSKVQINTQDKEHIKDSITYSDVQINTQDKVHTKDTITYSDVLMNSRRNMQDKEQTKGTITYTEAQRHSQNLENVDQSASNKQNVMSSVSGDHLGYSGSGLYGASLHQTRSAGLSEATTLYKNVSGVSISASASSASSSSGYLVSPMESSLKNLESVGQSASNKQNGMSSESGDHLGYSGSGLYGASLHQTRSAGLSEATTLYKNVSGVSISASASSASSSSGYLASPMESSVKNLENVGQSASNKQNVMSSVSGDHLGYSGSGLYGASLHQTRSAGLSEATTLYKNVSGVSIPASASSSSGYLASLMESSVKDKEQTKDTITYTEAQRNSQDKEQTKETITYRESQINTQNLENVGRSASNKQNGMSSVSGDHLGYSGSGLYGASLHQTRSAGLSEATTLYKNVSGGSISASASSALSSSGYLASSMESSVKDKEQTKDTFTYIEAQINSQGKEQTKDIITYSEAQRHFQDKEQPKESITCSEVYRSTQDKEQTKDTITYSKVQRNMQNLENVGRSAPNRQNVMSSVSGDHLGNTGPSLYGASLAGLSEAPSFPSSISSPPVYPVSPTENSQRVTSAAIDKKQTKDSITYSVGQMNTQDKKQTLLTYSVGQIKSQDIKQTKDTVTYREGHINAQDEQQMKDSITYSAAKISTQNLENVGRSAPNRQNVMSSVSGDRLGYFGASLYGTSSHLPWLAGLIEAPSLCNTCSRVSIPISALCACASSGSHMSHWDSSHKENNQTKDMITYSEVQTSMQVFAEQKSNHQGTRSIRQEGGQMSALIKNSEISEDNITDDIRSLLRPHPECPVQFSGPALIKDVSELERVQCHSTKLVKEMGEFSYEERQSSASFPLQLSFKQGVSKDLEDITSTYVYSPGIHTACIGNNNVLKSVYTYKGLQTDSLHADIMNGNECKCTEETSNHLNDGK
ncbi:uncharacterized protein LOC100486501 isoform X7 [Xenopus tropicalis]|uniref:Uncharacterized protein LOC100486501 isoform X7 n=1 Tax=Xenopus tropicalis TaxID=8364 RepID=A0A8J1IN26_XENTR|nr:uncharacterized protein LOC100486501 isoform X7 [Xenopus tropicalis]